MYRVFIMGGVFLLFFVCERLFPQLDRNTAGKNHDINNMILGVINLFLGRSFALFTVYYIAVSIESLGFGLLTYLPYNLKVISGIILLDCINYWWHRSLHKFNFLMRFHNVHHTDQLLDTSSALRFHFIEVLIGHLFKLPFIIVLGVPVVSFLFYDVIFNINVYFHHSNIRINRRLDLIISKVIVTPYLHRIHHSLKWKESNSNFSSFLILWDKVFGTFLPQGETSTPSYGIPGYNNKKYQTFYYMIKQPFTK